MPTFGDTGADHSMNYYTFAEDEAVMRRFADWPGGVITSIHAYMRGDAEGQYCRGIVYVDSGGPALFKALSGEFAMSGADNTYGLEQMDVPGGILVPAAPFLWLGLWFGASQGGIRLGMRAFSGGTCKIYSPLSDYSAGGNPPDSPIPSANNAARIRIYITYEPPEGGLSIPVAMRHYRNLRG